MYDKLAEVLEPNRVKEIRTGQNLAQWHLALLAYVAQSRLSQIENGLPAKPDEKKRLAMALCVGIGDLFDLEEGNATTP